MSAVTVRSDALVAVAQRLEQVAGSLRDDSYALTRALAAAPSETPWSGLGDPSQWVVVGSAVAARAEVLRLVGPAGLWGRAVDLDLLASRLRIAARTYAQVEQAASALLAGVAAGAELAERAGGLAEHSGAPEVRLVEPTVSVSTLDSPADLVALGAGIDGGRVRVLEVATGDGGSGWVVVVPGIQEWGPSAGANPFDATTDVRALAGDATFAALGVVAALEMAQARSGRDGAAPDGSAPGDAARGDAVRGDAARGDATADGPQRSFSEDPVLLAGHHQGGILAAALASDPRFTERNRVTHVVTTGAPVGLFPVPERVQVLSVEHADDPVPAGDLTPNPPRPGWLTLRVGSDDVASLDVARHDREAYRETLAAASEAPRGTMSGLSGWEASAGDFVGREVRSVTEVVVSRPGSATGA
ncbi:MAG: hypothetical protein ACRCXL_11400, partial [Dermatophilaceae bacterium]